MCVMHSLERPCSTISLQMLAQSQASVASHGQLCTVALHCGSRTQRRHLSIEIIDTHPSAMSSKMPILILAVHVIWWEIFFSNITDQFSDCVYICKCPLFVYYIYIYIYIYIYMSSDKNKTPMVSCTPLLPFGHIAQSTAPSHHHQTNKTSKRKAHGSVNRSCLMHIKSTQPRKKHGRTQKRELKQLLLRNWFGMCCGD